MSARTYSEPERAEAVALAAAIGPVKAAEQLSIPRRTVASWMHRPAASPIIAAAEANIADALRAAHATALTAVMAGLQDPKARLSDRARALEVLGEQLALAEGRATSHNLNLNATVDTEPELTWEEQGQLRNFLDSLEGASDEELLRFGMDLREYRAKQLPAGDGQPAPEDETDVG